MEKVKLLSYCAVRKYSKILDHFRQDMHKLFTIHYKIFDHLSSVIIFNYAL